MRPTVRALLCAATASVGLLAATPAPRPAGTPIDLLKIQPKSLLPKVPLHTEFLVAVNKLGQVTKILSGKPSKDRSFNLHTAGNALQAFIRTADGKAVPGSYRLTYDYDPKTTRIKRGVALVRRGGVDANAPGAVNAMMEDVRKHAKHPAPAARPTRKP